MPPDAGTARFSCRSTKVSWPLARSPVSSVMVLTRTGPSAIVKEPAADQAVAAAVPAVLITPWKERTRQNFGPGGGQRHDRVARPVQLRDVVLDLREAGVTGDLQLVARRLRVDDVVPA